MSIWTWTAVCADPKLVPSWMVGNRLPEAASEVMDDLRTRLADRVQLTNVFGGIPSKVFVNGSAGMLMGIGRGYKELVNEGWLALIVCFRGIFPTPRRRTAVDTKPRLLK